ncbi:MAG: HAMP domain-containing protein [Gammaproteobacteria bacterium]|nr:MAG: HAMP domain-containing protein [Gammaproteobacteria bacterium]
MFSTTAVRLAFRYTLVYLVVLGLVLGAFLWTTGKQIDARLETELERELSALSKTQAQYGNTHLIDIINRKLTAKPESGRYYLLVAEDGSRIAGNLLAWPDEADITPGGTVQTEWFDEEIIPGDRHGDDALLPAIVSEFDDGSRLLLAQDVPQSGPLNEVTEILIEIVGAAVVLGLVMSIILSRTILRRMDTISNTAGDIMTGDLSQRIPISDRDDEFDALAGRLNLMLDQIQLLIKGIREVTDNIAHDLRSPLTRLRNQLEVTLLEDRDPQEYRNALTQGIAETESLIRTFNALLSIAQAESGNHRAEWGTVNLDELAHDLADLYRASAEEKGQQLELITDNRSVITGSRDLLAQAIGNLLENAIKFTPDGGSIRLQVIPGRKTVDITLSDTGDGIPEAERAHVLERFVRLESARNTPGNGLGLSLVQAVATLHKAELLLGDSGPGLVVTLRFPQLGKNRGQETAPTG